MNNVTKIVLICIALAGSMAHSEETIVYSGKRPWGNSFVPRSPKPAEIIRQVSLSGLTKDEKIALCCLQGLVARVVQTEGLTHQRIENYRKSV